MLGGRSIAAAVLLFTSTAGALAADPGAYGARAEEVTEFIHRTYFDPASGAYARSLTERKPDYVWHQGVMLSNLVAAARADRVRYRPLLDRYVRALDAYWDPKVAIPGYEPAATKGNGNDKYYDDNAWLVISLLEDYESSREPRELARADDALRFVLSGWDEALGGGIWWHQLHKDGTKNTCSNGPAAVGCLRLARFRDGERAAELVEMARKIVAWTRSNLQDSDGLFDDRKVVSTGEVKRGKLTYNTALMIQALLGLYRATGEKPHLDEAVRVATAGDWFLDAGTGAYRDAPRYSHFMVEADLDTHRATGDRRFLERARKNADVLYGRWKAKPFADMVSNAALARILWLMAESETESGREFWRRADASRP
ncbi:Glycosyl hydrolase family 76 [Aquisphaera giovannonii]|uniref:Glycosyl hydrolase family 76 n=1 Tax=Aquisphaera giovannonii TaxID=406548 RepID=A0A5B9WCL6_9BACT|nr:glycoside hydrolase family 76 protein [Aquisphaera giovannonii]QEH37691.1 Glycosyl hydrolase family 76 [Aquisphaera giovannonii]